MPADRGDGTSPEERLAELRRMEEDWETEKEREDRAKERESVEWRGSKYDKGSK